VHAALGGGFFVLLDGHVGLLKSVVMTVAPAQLPARVQIVLTGRSRANAKPCIIARSILG
jgi:phosphopantetheine adenylyltransferase